MKLLTYSIEAGQNPPWFVRCYFTYDVAMKDWVKKIPGCTWDVAVRAWLVPIEMVQTVKQHLIAAGYKER